MIRTRNLKREILSYLSEQYEPATVARISVALGIPSYRIRQGLAALLERARVIRIDTYRWVSA